METYSFKITDTANDKLLNSELKAEIQNSGVITISVTDVRTTGDDIFIDFPVALSSTEQTELAAIVAAHTGESPTPVLIVRNQKASESGLNTLFHGFSFTGTKEQTVSSDFVMPEDREIEGAIVHVYNHSPGDFIELSLWMPGSPEVKLADMACEVQIPPSGEFPEFTADRSKPLPAGLILRVSYTSVVGASVDATIGVNFRFERKNAVS